MVVWIAALVILGGAAAARIWGLLTEPLWLDEAYSAYAAGKGWAFLWQVVPRYETHPPFYYSLLRSWSLIWGDSLGGLRSLGVVCALMTLPAIALAARELGRALALDGGRLAILILAALGLAAAAPVMVEMAREVRPYPVMILVYAVAIGAVLRVGRRAAEGRPLGGRAYTLYLAMLALILWLHNLGPLYAASLGLALLALVLRRSMTRGDWLWLAGGHVLVALAWLPALLILIDQAPTWVQSTWLSFTFKNLWWRIAVLYTLPDKPELLATILLIATALLMLARSGEGRRIGFALCVTAFLPVALSVALSALVSPVFILRTLTPVAVPGFLLMALGAAGPSGWWRWPMLGGLALVAGNMAATEIAARERGRPMQDWYGALRWLEPRFRPGDVVYAYPNEGALPFDRAVRDKRLAMPSRAVPGPIPALHPPPGSWYVSGSRGVPSLDRAHLRVIARGAGDVPTVWLLRLGPWAYDKGDVFLNELSVGREQVGHWRKGPIDIIGLRRTSAPVPTPEQPQP